MGRWSNTSTIRVLCLLLVAGLPLTAYANKGPTYAIENLPWVVFGELVPIIIETALVRRFFDVSYRKAFIVVLIANGISFFLPMYVGFQVSENILGLLSDLGHGFFPGNAGSYASFTESFFALLLINCIWTLIIETPVYAIGLWKTGKYHWSYWMIPALNLISYPIYFTLVWLAVEITSRASS